MIGMQELDKEIESLELQVESLSIKLEKLKQHRETVIDSLIELSEREFDWSEVSQHREEMIESL